MQNKKEIPSGFSLVSSAHGFDEFIFEKNGLRVLIMEDHSLPLAGFMLTYLVGSRHEAVGHTGAAHLLEHLMFKRTKKYNEKNKTDMTALFNKWGAFYNATTWNDRTNYFEIGDKSRFADFVSIQADQMRSSGFTEKDRQGEMTIVRNEFEIGENDPIEILDKHSWAIAYEAHPYHHSTIGWRSDIENMPISVLKSFYNTFYKPNNAVAVAVGDIKTNDALKIIAREFRDIKPNDKIRNTYTVEPKQEGERRFTISRETPENVVSVSYKTPEALSEDTYTFIIIDYILARSVGNRLEKALVDTGIASAVSSRYMFFKDPGLFSILAFSKNKTDHSKIEEDIKKECIRLINEPIPKNELESVREQIKTDKAVGKDGLYANMQAINEGIAVGDWKFYLELEDKLSAVSAEDCMRIAKKYFVNDSCTVGHFIEK